MHRILTGMSVVVNGPAFHPIRHGIIRGGLFLLVRLVVRLRIEGREHLSDRPVLYCFNHMSWSDPVILLAMLPWRPQLAIFGPREEDMKKGFRNRFIGWVGLAVPYKPSRNDLIDTTRRVQRVFEAGWSRVEFIGASASCCPFRRGSPTLRSGPRSPSFRSPSMGPAGSGSGAPFASASGHRSRWRDVSRGKPSPRSPSTRAMPSGR
jgi:hypothetical protein